MLKKYYGTKEKENSMKNLQNLHMHSVYDDGKDKLEDTIITAIGKGFDSIGFSGHSYTHYSLGYCMSLEGTKEFKKEVFRLKEKYRDKIKIFCGLEFDMYSTDDVSGCDYLLGAVHYLLKDGVYVPFDRAQNEVKEAIDQYFGGDGMAFAKEYYKQLAKLPEYGDFDIIAHFDIITKHADNVEFFEQSSPVYIEAAIEALNALKGKIPYFEVNTGAIARGYRKSPYPAEFLIKEMKRMGFGAVITSDCHDRNLMDYAFDDAVNLLKKCGFEERYILTEQGFKPVSL